MDTAKTAGLNVEDEKVYGAYRSTLRKMTGNRAGARRNAARHIIVERYNVSFRDLKKIVQEGDAIHGVEHPHTPEYLAKLKFATDARLLEEEYSSYTGCPQCKNVDAFEVRVRVNPFDIEVYSEYNPLYTCFECYLKIGEDV